MQSIGLIFEPLDPLFFRDGRPFIAGTQLESGRPMPQTVTGALRTWLLREAGCDFGKLRASIKRSADFASAALEQSEDKIHHVARMRFRGPWFVESLDGGNAAKPLVPAPATLYRNDESGGILRSDPLSSGRILPGWKAPMDGMLPLWRPSTQKAERLGGFITLDGLTAFLAGGVPGPEQIRTDDNIFRFDYRTGIAIDPKSLSTEEGMIYSIGMLALKEDIGLYSEIESCESGREWLETLFENGPITIPLGGEGKRVAVSICSKHAAWPDISAKDGAGNARAVDLARILQRLAAAATRAGCRRRIEFHCGFRLGFGVGRAQTQPLRLGRWKRLFLERAPSLQTVFAL